MCLYVFTLQDWLAATGRNQQLLELIRYKIYFVLSLIIVSSKLHIYFSSSFCMSTYRLDAGIAPPGSSRDGGLSSATKEGLPSASHTSHTADSDQERHLLPRALNLEGISLGK